MLDRGYPPASRVLRQSVIPAPLKVSERLEVPVDTPVFEIRHLRGLPGKPSFRDTAWLPYALCASVLDMDLSQQSL